ncbi:MAG: response regulator transcription factor [Verrucomicrobiales bacterium]|nr:response regulator transcription factor [Verrucomicrobiales bacterium]
METVLLIDDESDLLDLLAFSLEPVGYRTIKEASGVEGLRALEAGPPDLILLDLVLPDMSGFEVLHRIREHPGCNFVPVMILSARGAVEDRIEALSRGADDYLGKPFSMKELVLRVHSLVRRSSANRNVIQSGTLIVDQDSFRCFLGGKQLDLTTIEYKILTCLLKGDGKILPRKRIVEQVWGHTLEGSSRSLDTHVKRLRGKLGTRADAIRTVRSKGYRLVPPGL